MDRLEAERGERAGAAERGTREEAGAGSAAGAGGLLERLLRARALTEAVCRPLAVEDHGVQPYEWVSPPKWHLAHTTWFFETFLLAGRLPRWVPSGPAYAFLFNSYYESQGPRADKGRRGTYSRPTVEEIRRYRARVDEALGELLASPAGRDPEVAALVELGIQHEQQHQELLLYDIKCILRHNPSRPAYGPLPAGFPGAEVRGARGGNADWSAAGLEVPGGIYTVGHAGGGFAFDNEGPRHEVLLRDFRIRRGLVTNGEWLAFVADGGYRRPELWLSAGWKAARAEGWEAPLYWERADGGEWLEYGWRGMAPLDPDAPVRHVSHYEADAFARWRGARLPLEAEREVAEGGLEAGAAWEWTGSAYLPYPGFRPFAGAVGEYNGKFMSGQIVLRGSSEATPEGHARPTYRNFYQPQERWQIAGLRLAEDP